MLRTYQICKYCIMDNSNSEIVIDKTSVCNHRANYVLKKVSVQTGKEKWKYL